MPRPIRKHPQDSDTHKFCYRGNHLVLRSDFNKDKKASDGLYTFCRECGKKRWKEWKSQSKNAESKRERDRIRYHNNPDHAHERVRLWRIGRGYKKKIDYDRLTPEKTKARRALCYAVTAGIIVRPKSCGACGLVPSNGIIQGHHEDYTKPFDVAWVCTKCHNLIHKQKRRERDDATAKPVG